MEDIWNEYQVYESDEINYIDDHMKMRYGKVDNVDREDSGIENKNEQNIRMILCDVRKLTNRSRRKWMSKVASNRAAVPEE